MSVAGRKAKEVFQSHNSVRSERLWEIESPIRKVIAQSADQGALGQGRKHADKSKSRVRGEGLDPGFATM